MKVDNNINLNANLHKRQRETHLGESMLLAAIVDFGKILNVELDSPAGSCLQPIISVKHHDLTSHKRQSIQQIVRLMFLLSIYWHTLYHVLFYLGMREGVLPLQMFSKVRISDVHRNAVSTLVGFPRRDIVARNDSVTMKNCMKWPLWKTLAKTKPAGVGLFHASICMTWNGCLMLDRTVHGPCILYGNPYKIVQKRWVDQSHQHLEQPITTLDRNILIDHQRT